MFGAAAPHGLLTLVMGAFTKLEEEEMNELGPRSTEPLEPEEVFSELELIIELIFALFKFALNS